jgi:hypothetical protein
MVAGSDIGETIGRVIKLWKKRLEIIIYIKTDNIIVAARRLIY